MDLDFNSTSALVREAANGALALSSILLVIIFARYCWRNRLSFWKNQSVQVAGAILVLMSGHTVRAFGAWIEFFMLRKDLDLVGWFFYSWIWFATAVAMILFGKALMLYSFAPLQWRWRIIIPGMIICMIIPIVVVMLT